MRQNQLQEIDKEKERLGKLEDDVKRLVEKVLNLQIQTTALQQELSELKDNSELQSNFNEADLKLLRTMVDMEKERHLKVQGDFSRALFGNNLDIAALKIKEGASFTEIYLYYPLAWAVLGGHLAAVNFVRSSPYGSG